MRTNLLTKRLLAAGYAKDNHPDYVCWSQWGCFEYTPAYLAKTLWETPCGLVKYGKNYYHHVFYDGMDYCAENNNPLFPCPYFDEVSCKHRISTAWGLYCACRQVEQASGHQNVEELWAEWDRIEQQAWLDIGGVCACMEWDRPSRKYVPRFDVEECINARCKNEVCLVTRQPRNLEKVNIYFDIQRVKRFRLKTSLFEHEEKTIEKGIKVFERQVARTDAEIWIKLHKANFVPLKQRMTPDDYLARLISEYYDKPEEVPEYLYWVSGNVRDILRQYNWFEFKISPENIRIERKEIRDLMQDLQDVAAGFEVVHLSDIAKAEAQAKREERKRYQEAKARRKVQEKIEQMSLF